MSRGSARLRIGRCSGQRPRHHVVRHHERQVRIAGRDQSIPQPGPYHHLPLGRGPGPTWTPLSQSDRSISSPRSGMGSRWLPPVRRRIAPLQFSLLNSVQYANFSMRRFIPDTIDLSPRSVRIRSPRCRTVRRPANSETSGHSTLRSDGDETGHRGSSIDSQGALHVARTRSRRPVPGTTTRSPPRPSEPPARPRPAHRAAGGAGRALDRHLDRHVSDLWSDAGNWSDNQVPPERRQPGLLGPQRRDSRLDQRPRPRVHLRFDHDHGVGLPTT